MFDLVLYSIAIILLVFLAFAPTYVWVQNGKDGWMLFFMNLLAIIFLGPIWWFIILVAVS